MPLGAVKGKMVRRTSPPPSPSSPPHDPPRAVQHARAALQTDTGAANPPRELSRFRVCSAVPPVMHGAVCLEADTRAVVRHHGPDVCPLLFQQAAEGLDGNVMDMDPNDEAPPGGASIHDAVEEAAPDESQSSESEEFSD